jgi:DNA-binding transcriptional LysR family regulator
VVPTRKGPKWADPTGNVPEMELRHVRYFVAVAEELHFGRAAIRLHIAQPPLSVQIQSLERMLGVSLFDRGNRKIRLTKEGEVFLIEARRLLEQSERATRAVHQVASGKLGSLNIAGVSSAFYDLLPEVIPRYRSENPHVVVMLREMDTAEAMEALREGVIDVAFTRSDEADDDIELRRLNQEDFFVAVPTNHILATRTEVELSDLAKEPFIMPRRSVSPSYYDQMLTAVRAAGFSPRISHESLTIQSQVSFVACGLGVALVPASARLLRAHNVAWIPLASPVSITELVVAWPKGDVPPAVSNFLSILGEVVRATEPG